MNDCEGETSSDVTPWGSVCYSLRPPHRQAGPGSEERGQGRRSPHRQGRGRSLLFTSVCLEICGCLHSGVREKSCEGGFLRHCVW